MTPIEAAAARLRADRANGDEFMLTCRTDKLADMFQVVRAYLAFTPPAVGPELELPDAEGVWWNAGKLWNVSRYDERTFTGHVIYPPAVRTVGYELPLGRWVRCVPPAPPSEKETPDGK